MEFAMGSQLETQSKDCAMEKHLETLMEKHLESMMEQLLEKHLANLLERLLETNLGVASGKRLVFASASWWAVSGIRFQNLCKSFVRPLFRRGGSSPLVYPCNAPNIPANRSHQNSHK